MLEKVFSFMDRKELMPLRIVRTDWKSEIDMRLEKKTLQIWLPTTTCPDNFSTLVIFNTFSREVALFRFCCPIDIQVFQRNLQMEQVIIPGKSIMVGKTMKNPPESLSQRLCGKTCQNKQGGVYVWNISGAVHPNADVVVQLLRQVGNNLNVVIFSNFQLTNCHNPGNILPYFLYILKCLQKVKVIVLNNAFSTPQRKALRRDRKPI